MNETNCSKFKKRAAVIAVASCLSFAPFLAEAAGLGKLTVLSGLGQPLRAELELGANRDELAGMTARLAPQDAFRQAGIDFASALTDLRFAVEKRSNGQSFVKVTSARPINEPFLDFLVELNWPSGRLVREYTFLLDPPEIAARQTARPVVDAKVIDTVQGGGAAVERPAAVRPAAPRPAAAPRMVAEPKKTDGEATRVVQPGDTLRKIAAETQHDGVSLEQMLVGLFRKNPEAFSGNNINRLKSGAILGIPEKAAVEAVSEAEAKKVYVAQAADWNAYRQKLAGATAKAPAREEAAGQTSSGKITAKVEEKVTPAEQAKDKVKVSPTEISAKGSTAEGEADRVAKDKALRDAQERLAMLEKNVNELQKLVEMKNQKLAELQQQMAAKPVEPAKPVEAPKPVEPPKVVEAQKVPEPAKVVEVPPPVEPPKPVEEPKPPVVEKPVEPPKPAEPPPQPKAPVAPPPPPVEEPGMLDSLLEDPLPLAGGAGALALLAGYFMLKRRREQNPSLVTTTAPGPSSLGPNSVFRMTGGQSVDTGNTPPQTGDFSQTGPGTIDTDEVDPVAEADVYMAYGRDTQAEEILLEAMQKDPQRTAIHAKLLEIYANRRSVKQFETLASELYAQSGGVGPEWAKVAALGVALDPENPLYSGAARPAAAFDADATMVASPEDIAKSTLTMPAGVLAQLAEAGTPEAVPESPASIGRVTPVLPEQAAAQPLVSDDSSPESTVDAMSLDFNLDFATPVPEPDVKAISDSEPEFSDAPFPDTVTPADVSGALDFDLGSELPAPESSKAPVGELQVAQEDSFEFDIQAEELPDLARSSDKERDFSPEGTLVMPSSFNEAGISTYVGGEVNPEPKVVEEPAPEDTTLDFDLDLDAPAVQTSVNAVTDNIGTETLVMSHSFGRDTDLDNPKLVDTVVSDSALGTDSLEFDVNLADSVFLGQPMMEPAFDIGSINLDLAAEPAAAPAKALAELPDVESPSVAPPEATPPDAPVHDAHWEEVNTKLDLAKAYEEMGDLEGARELLQEVVGEGSVDLVEQARTILGRIGE